MLNLPRDKIARLGPWSGGGGREKSVLGDPGSELQVRREQEKMGDDNKSDGKKNRIGVGGQNVGTKKIWTREAETGGGVP